MSANRNIDTARQIAKAVAERGGAVYYVGGFVRDRLMGLESKDVDIEVHGVTAEQLEGILDGIGERLQMGRSFGIYGLKGCDIDIAMPRTETAVGRGHRDFRVEVDPFIGTKKAAVRRDFTVNAIMQNVLTDEIIDHFSGQQDLEKRIIRHVNDESFAEDALRVLRAAQFSARFGFCVAPETVELCRRIDLSQLSRERVFDETKKALLKADKPSVFFEVLREMGQLSVWFPEVEALIGVRQDSRHHAEGDVWTHTLLVLDAAAQYRDRVSDPTGFMLSALCHDFGKAVCTSEANGRIHAYGHEKEGVPLAGSFITRLTGEKALLKYVTDMVELHMKPGMMISDNSSIKSTNKLFDESVEPDDLIYLSSCDSRGSLPASGYELREKRLLERLQIYRDYMSRPYVRGCDLVEAGLKSGVELGEVLSLAHKLRLAGIDKESALRQCISFARANKNKS